MPVKLLPRLQDGFEMPLFVCCQGFGEASGEHWLGNDFANRLTAQQSYKLRIELSDWEGNSGFAQYEQFSLDSETQNYRYVVLETHKEHAHSTFLHNDSADSAFFWLLPKKKKRITKQRRLVD